MVAIFSGNRQWLRRCISAMFMLLFALSITPRKVLHDVLVNHKDDISYQHQSAPSIAKSGFHCDTDNNVAESPFTGEEPASLPARFTAFISFDDAVNSPLHSIDVFYFSLRGPPATV
jgi:hypothetical protein